MPPPSLLTLIVEVTPETWTVRAKMRAASDADRLAKKKPTAGPCKLDELMVSIVGFVQFHVSLSSKNEVAIILVWGSGVDVVYDSYLNGCGVDLPSLKESLEMGAKKIFSDASKVPAASPTPPAKIAAALTLALMKINSRLHRGKCVTSISHAAKVSISNESARSQQETRRKSVMEGKTENELRGDDGGGGKGEVGPAVVEPRIFVVQIGSDCMRDYNACMNCVFAAKKMGITIDALFLPGSWEGEIGSKGHGDTPPPEDSIILQQGAALTGGIYMPPPKKSAQLPALLLQILVNVYLPSPGPPSTTARSNIINTTRLQKVDYRGRCFETGEAVEIAVVCNVCLSVFGVKVAEKMQNCSTCGSLVVHRA